MNKEAFYYNNFLKEQFYIIRWLKSGGYHHYPRINGELPEGFTTRKEAKEHSKKWYKNFKEDYGKDYKIINGKEASKYPVPKRW